MQNKKISVICPSLLEEFPGCSPKRPEKFIRAVESFLNQTYKNSEIIIVADGCKKTIDICNRRYKREMKYGLIKLIELPEKTPRELFVGGIRQQGIEHATGDILCNLDSDDYFLPNHLYNIAATFNPEKSDWAFYNYYRKLDNLKGVEEVINAEPTLDGLCTINVVWRKGLDVSWNNCSGRMDNKAFNKQLIEKYKNKIKIFGCQYYVCHANFTHVSNK